MAQRAIREYDAKTLLIRHWDMYIEGLQYRGPLIQVCPGTAIRQLTGPAPWLETERLVVKPDVLAGRRGKHGLILLNASWPDALAWVEGRRETTVTIGGVQGELSHFLIEPYVDAAHEYYLAIRTERECDVLLFGTTGGLEIESHWDLVREARIPVLAPPPGAEFYEPLFAAEDLHPETGRQLARFCSGLYRLFRDAGFTFMELNPFAVRGEWLFPLDLKARIDDTARPESGQLWGQLDFPAPFGRRLTAEEQAVARIDERSGASLKLTVLNPGGRVWTMVAGGGASVVYTDTIADLGWAAELGNYGEYSGNPSLDETYEYTKIVLDLMTRGSPGYGDSGESKVLIIGGGIANFTDVAATFAGIVRALREYAPRLRDTGARILVRRGGPNYREGLRLMRELGDELGVPTQVYGPETHMTRVISMALGGAGEAHQDG
jgi:ATP-citrate lyase beta-subunit